MNNFDVTIYQRKGSREDPKHADGYITIFTIKQGEKDTLAKAVEYDNCLACYKNGHRKTENFLKADCILADLDNTHSENEKEWITHKEVEEQMPNVAFYYYPSRNNKKKKNGKKPRPKEHLIFPINEVKSVLEYRRIMKFLVDVFPQLHFDDGATISTQLNFGVKGVVVEYVEGEHNLSEVMSKFDVSQEQSIVETASVIKMEDIIPEGKRNTTLHQFALSKLTRWGDADDKAHQEFISKAAMCSPPLDGKELDTIWKSAVSFFQTTIKVNPEYTPPDKFGSKNYKKSLKPDDFTDVGQARRFVQEYGELVRFSKATKYMYYDTNVWIENEIKVHSMVQNFTILQLWEALNERKNAQKELDSAVLSDEDKEEAERILEKAKIYHKFILKCRHSSRISATMKEAQPMVELDVSCLDIDGLILNTPDGTVDLRTKQMNQHSPADYCTKITAVGLADKGADLFYAFLKVITCGDKSLEDYLQLVAGMSAVGRVYSENLIIAYGSGRNGKSTLFNLLAKVMGDYSGSLSAETLTANCRKNKGPEYAELRGKRLVIAAELEEGMRLDTSIVKKLCSTDPIYAEKKFKAPFSFTPTHTVVLYTNHLPSVGTSDDGTWRRLIVVPFNAVIGKSVDKKNFADHLFKEAGGAVLSWIVEGAEKYIAADGKITLPEVVKQAIEEYRQENDWLNDYISERCEKAQSFYQKAGALYADYREYCLNTGEFTRSKKNFKTALIDAGYIWDKKNTGAFYSGLRLLPKYTQFNRFQDIEMPKITPKPTTTELPSYEEVTNDDDKKQDFSDTDDIIF